MSRPDVSARPSPDAGTLLRWLPLAVWVISMVNALAYLDRGWFPHDLGTVTHPAQRVLLGELPHRDFQDVYTGGLAFLNALTFRLLGETATAARWAALVFYSAWVPAVWAVARTLAGARGHWLAAAVTVLAAAWTLPMYAEGMPSWFNLFMATFALLALLRFHEDGRRRWLFWAGVAAGASVLFKIIGLYSVAAGLLALAWMEDASRPDASEPGPSRDASYRWFIAACALALAAMVVGLVTRAMGFGGLVRFGLPALTPTLVIAWASRRPTGVASRERLRSLVGLLLPYLLGVVLAVAPFLILYLASGALHDLYVGVFVMPQQRLADAAWTGHRGGFLGAGLAGFLVAVVAWAPRLRNGAANWAAGAAVLTGLLALAFSGTWAGYSALWQSMWWSPPMVAAAGVVIMVTRSGPAAPATPIFLALAYFGLASLVEVPFAAPIYFFYAAPLLLLLATGLAARSGAGSRRWLSGVVAVLLGFTALSLNPGFVRHLGYQPTRHVQTEVLNIPRGGGLRVDAPARDEIEAVVKMVEELAPGPFIYATPDAPELYFLTGRRNPTGSLYEFFDLDPDTRAQRVLDALDRHGVSLVVINRNPFFSSEVGPELVAGLQIRYPMAREVGRFLVVWREAQ